MGKLDGTQNQEHHQKYGYGIMLVFGSRKQLIGLRLEVGKCNLTRTPKSAPFALSFLTVCAKSGAKLKCCVLLARSLLLCSK